MVLLSQKSFSAFYGQFCHGRSHITMIKYFDSIIIYTYIICMCFSVSYTAPQTSHFVQGSLSATSLSGTHTDGLIIQ